MTSCTHLLYLHGFRSSPRSAKAQRMARWVAEERPDLHFESPQLPPSPAEAFALIAQLTANWPALNMIVMGSSLGGFYATALAEKRGCRAVVINPAVDPARDLHTYIGTQTYWHDPSQSFQVLPEFMGELRAIQVPALAHPQRYFALVAKGDEVLDWREMAARYAGAQLRLIEGSDHGVSDFDAHLSFVAAFLQA